MHFVSFQTSFKISPGQFCGAKITNFTQYITTYQRSLSIEITILLLKKMMLNYDLTRSSSISFQI
jgi:hypothetical protein